MPKERRVFAITGPIGSGKNALARKLVHGMNVYHIDWKAVLQRADSERFVHDFARILKGEIPVSTRLTVELLSHALEVVPEGEPIVFTGIPSTTCQVRVFRDLGLREPTIVFLDATNTVCKERLVGRSGFVGSVHNLSEIIEEIYRFREFWPVILRECTTIYGSDAVKFVDGMSPPDQVYAGMVQIMSS